MSVDHYENFPVASVLCPPALRPAVKAIYHFARTADDLADEGDAAPEARRDALLAYRRQLHEVAAGRPATHWQPVFDPLQDTLRRHHLPVPLLDDLLDAFLQDLTQHRYDDRPALLDYCRRSANPVGRLLLHLYGVHDTVSLRQSDAICSALQLANFWQDLSVDTSRGRLYVPLSDASQAGVLPEQLLDHRGTPATTRLIDTLVTWTRGLMLDGAPLVHTLPGRAGWELRLVVQGGLRILDHVAEAQGATLYRRPTLGWRDGPVIAWRSLGMRRPAISASEALR